MQQAVFLPMKQEHLYVIKIPKFILIRQNIEAKLYALSLCFNGDKNRKWDKY